MTMAIEQPDVIRNMNAALAEMPRPAPTPTGPAIENKPLVGAEVVIKLSLSPGMVTLMAAPVAVLTTMLLGWLALRTLGMPIFASEMFAGAIVSAVGGMFAALPLFILMKKGAQVIAQAGILGIALRIGATLMGLLIAGPAPAQPAPYAFGLLGAGILFPPAGRGDRRGRLVEHQGQALIEGSIAARKRFQWGKTPGRGTWRFRFCLRILPDFAGFAQKFPQNRLRPPCGASVCSCWRWPYSARHSGLSPWDRSGAANTRSSHDDRPFWRDPKSEILCGPPRCKRPRCFVQKRPHQRCLPQKRRRENVDSRSLVQQKFHNIAPPGVRCRPQRALKIAVAPVKSGINQRGIISQQFGNAPNRRAPVRQTLRRLPAAGQECWTFKNLRGVEEVKFLWIILCKVGPLCQTKFGGKCICLHGKNNL